MTEQECLPEGIEGAAIHSETVLLENYLRDLRSSIQELTDCDIVPKYTRLMQIRAANRQLIDLIADVRKHNDSILTSYRRGF